MKVKRNESSQERAVLIGMVTSRAVLGAVAARWQPLGLFSSRWANLIGGWCVEHYCRYKKAPSKNIVGLFDDWATSGTRDKETQALVEKFLGSISEEYKRAKQDVNPDYLIDIANRYFTKVRLQELSQSIQAHLEDGEIEEADKLTHSYSKVQVGGDNGTNVFSDESCIVEALESKVEPLIVYEHGLDVFFGDAMERDGLVSFMGPEKRGKTWMLIDTAWRAMQQGRRVAFFSVGDMSRNQIMRRLIVRAACRPLKAKKLLIPTTLSVEEGEKTATVDHEEKIWTEPLSTEDAVRAMKKINKRNGGEERFRLSVHPNSSLSVYGLQSILDSWSRNEWVPDVIVIDYADILAPVSGAVDSREQINTTWKHLRSISQSLHCLVVTATQAKASSYTMDIIGKSEFADDKRKLAHVTGMIGLNATNKEKDLGLLRLNWIVLREEESSELKCCHLAGCLGIGNPAILSYMD